MKILHTWLIYKYANEYWTRIKNLIIIDCFLSWLVFRVLLRAIKRADKNQGANANNAVRADIHLEDHSHSEPFYYTSQLFRKGATGSSDTQTGRNAILVTVG